MVVPEDLATTGGTVGAAVLDLKPGGVVTPTTPIQRVGEGRGLLDSPRVIHRDVSVAE